MPISRGKTARTKRSGLGAALERRVEDELNGSLDDTETQPGLDQGNRDIEFPATEVRLEISSETDGEMVIADAIRWVPLD